MMKEYFIAFRECLNNPIGIIISGKLWLILIFIEMITLAFVILLHKKYGRIFGITKLYWSIAAGFLIGYFIHFIFVVVLLESFYNSCDFIL